MIIAAMMLVFGQGTAMPYFITLEDGSRINVTLTSPGIPIKTTYGTLTVPTGDIERITFATRHRDPDMVTALVKKLESNVFAERDKASKELVSLGRTALPYLQSTDMEAKKRLAGITEMITATDSRPVVQNDTITAKHGMIIGVITVIELTVTNKVLGEKTIPLHGFTELSIQSPTQTTVEAGEWTRFGGVRKGSRITATGTIDFWPPSPGQFVSGPKGNVACSQNGNWAAGTLLGKIGDKEFFISDGCDVPVTGELMIRVISSTWGVRPVGHYKVATQ